MKPSTKEIRFLETLAPPCPKAKEKQRLAFALWRSSADFQSVHISTCSTPSFGQESAIDCSLQTKERSLDTPPPARACSKKGAVQFGRPQIQPALVTNPLSIADNGGANWALEDYIQGHCWLRGEFTQRHCNFVVCVMRASNKAIRFLETLIIPEGPLAGQKLKLAPFQKKFVKGALADGI